MANYSRHQVDRLRQLIEEARDLPDEQIDAWKHRALFAVAAVYGENSPQTTRFEKIRWTLPVATDRTPSSAFRDARRAGLRSAAEMLSAIVEDVEAHTATPELPGAHPGGMHPWVEDAAARLWADGHRQQAVQAAAAAIETWLRAKTGAHTGSSASLAASAFSTSPPASGSPRLRFREVGPEGSDTWKSAHDGAGAFGRGCMLRIRNLYTHNAGVSEAEDLEGLAALSLFARWVDEAELTEVGES